MATIWDTNITNMNTALANSTYGLGEAVTYTDKDGNTTAITDAVFMLVSVEDDRYDNQSGQTQVTDAMCDIRTSVLASVEKYGTITHDSTVYVIHKVETEEGMHRLFLHITSTSERSIGMRREI